jgi:hypothetical protein
MGWDGVISIGTRYGLDDIGIESQRGRDFLHPSRPTLGLAETFLECVRGFFRGGNAAGAWR